MRRFLHFFLFLFIVGFLVGLTPPAQKAANYFLTREWGVLRSQVAPPNDIQLPGLFMFLKFDEGGYPVQDSSGTAQIIAQYGSAAQFVSGKFQNAIKFDGRSGLSTWDIVKVRDQYQASTEKTLEAWVNPSLALFSMAKDLDPQNASLKGSPIIDATNHGLYYTVDGKFLFRIKVPGAGWAFVTADSPAGQWAHVVAVYKASSFIKLYLNGSLAGETSISSPMDASFGRNLAPPPYDGPALYIDIAHTYKNNTVADLSGINVPEYYFTGILDNMRIYTRALDDAAIAQIAPAVCGNNIPQSGEQCDGSSSDPTKKCVSCQLIDKTKCGDGNTDTPNEMGKGGPKDDGFEECDEATPDCQNCTLKVAPPPPAPSSGGWNYE